MRHRPILRLLPLLLLTSCSPPPPAAPPVVESPAVRMVVTDAGRPEWGPFYSLEDGRIAVQIAPSIGRVMHLSRAGEPNLLWTSDDPTRESFRGWKPFGGEKLWPWPQKPAWDWPPPVAIDTGPYRCEPLQDGRRGFTVAGPADPATGLAATRETWLEQGVVRSVYRLERRHPAKHDTPVAAWSVAQVPVVDKAYVRLLPGQSDRPTPMSAGRPMTPTRVNDRWLKVPARYDGVKVGFAADAIAVPIGDRVLLVERIEGNADRELDYAHAAQLYFHRTPRSGIADPSVFAEVELIGPSRRLAVGESCSLSTRWTVRPLDHLPELLEQR